MEGSVGIIGLGHALPATVRLNSDPVFDWLRKNHPAAGNLFTGFNMRNVLAPGESIIDILLSASLAALADAGIAPGDIDHVIGAVSPGVYTIPDSLFELSHRLGLGERTLTIPLNNDFSNFTVSLRLADALVRSGRAQHVLVAIGGAWSRAVSYTTPWAVSVGDAAAAVVVGSRPDKTPYWTVIDDDVISREMNFGEMGLYPDPAGPPASGTDGLPASDATLQRLTGEYFHITPEGLSDFVTFGGATAPTAALRLVARQGLDPASVTITGHQVSEVLFDQWRKLVAPSPVFETLSAHGNMTVANIPFNLCLLTETVTTPFVIALSLAPDMHAHAILLRRHRSRSA